MRAAQTYEAFQYDGTNLADLVALLDSNTRGRTYVTYTAPGSQWTLIVASGYEGGAVNANALFWIKSGDWFVVQGRFADADPATTFGQTYVLADDQYQQTYAS